MKRFIWMGTLLASAILTSVPIGCTSRPSVKSNRLPYPVTATTNTIDAYHGTNCADPYRWLEDENGEGTRQWIEAENARHLRLSGIPPGA